MFDHVKFGVSDYAASKAFFLKALEPLGVAVVAEGAPTYGIELCPEGHGFIVPVPNRGEAGASSPGVRGRESRAGRRLLSRGPGGGWQGQWCAWPAPELQRELLRGFRHWSGRAQHRSGLPRTRGLTRRCSEPRTVLMPSFEKMRLQLVVRAAAHLVLVRCWREHS